MAGKSKYTFESKIHVYRATKRMTQQELQADDTAGTCRFSRCVPPDHHAA